MTPEPNPASLVNRTADEGLLAEDAANLPALVGRPELAAPMRTRSRLVGLGATLTAVSLIAGVILIGLGVFGVVSGGAGLLSVVGLVLGAALVGTHWGWVHVAEATADAIEGRRDATVQARRRQWLNSIEPYTRYEITTGVTDDGDITIDRVEHRAVPVGDRTFTFVRTTERLATYAGDDGAAAVAERAELLRQQAAVDTDQERRRFEREADAHRGEQLGDDAHHQENAVRRAGAEAVSDEINSRLRDPPID
jgi:hypothetical protein